MKTNFKLVKQEKERQRQQKKIMQTISKLKSKAQSTLGDTLESIPQTRKPRYNLVVKYDGIRIASLNNTQVVERSEEQRTASVGVGTDSTLPRIEMLTPPKIRVEEAAENATPISNNQCSMSPHFAMNRPNPAIKRYTPKKLRIS